MTCRSTRALALFVVPVLAGACARGPATDAGSRAESAPAGVTAPWFREAAAERGLDFTWESGHQARRLLPEITGGGVALADLDDDGDLDVYLVQSGGVLTAREARPPNQLFENLGGGRFRDATLASGAGDRGAGNGVACGDVDGDGDVDLFVTNVGPDVLLRNDGGLHFTDVTLEAGLGDPGYGTSAAFVDADGDGDLDLFVARYVAWSVDLERDCPGAGGEPDYCQPGVYDAPTSDLLYRNDGMGRFSDVSLEAGVASARGTGLGVLPADFDGDGRLDVFVANDALPDRLWRNLGDGRFEDVAARVGCAVDEAGHAKAGMGVAAADLDGDLDLELLVVNLTGETDSLFRNELGGARGSRRFEDVTALSGLAGASRALTRFGVGFADFDQDGFVDLLEANGRVTRAPRADSGGDSYAEFPLLLRGRPALRFEALLPAALAAALPPGTGRAAAFGDVDGDGAVDVVIVNRDGPARLLLNTHPQRGHWLLLDVREAQGAPALGATLTLAVGARRVRADVRAAGSYQASSDPRVHVGLGAASRVDAVTVRWTDGTHEAFGPFEADQAVSLRRGCGGQPAP